MNQSQWIGYLTFLVLLVIPRIVAAQQVSFSQISIFLKENGEGKVIIDTRPHSQLEPWKALNPEKKVSLPFFGSAEVAKFDEVRYHLRYDFSRFRSLSELKNSAMNEDGEKLWPTLKIDPEENALVLTPDPMLNNKSRLWFPLTVKGNVALRANLVGASAGLLRFQLMEKAADGEVVAIAIHGANSPENEPAGTVTVGQKQANRNLEIKGKTTVATNEKQEINFQLSDGLMERNLLIIGYEGATPIGFTSLDVIAQFPASFGIGFDQNQDKILVNRVLVGGSGEAAGVKVGDQLQSVNGRKPQNLKEAILFLIESSIEKETTVEIVRLGKARTIQLLPSGVQRAP